MRFKFQTWIFQKVIFWESFIVLYKVNPKMLFCFLKQLFLRHEIRPNNFFFLISSHNFIPQYLY